MSREARDNLTAIMDAHPSTVLDPELAGVGETRDECRRLWLAAEAREYRVRLALARIADRASRILDGRISTGAIGAATYDLSIAREALDS